MPKILIKAENLYKSFGSTPVVSNMSFEVYEGEFLTMLGPSGCGKTTTLRMIAGFVNPDRGVLELDGQDITGVPANRRAVNTVFQNYVLFPNLSVRENIGYGLMVRKTEKKEMKKRVDEMLELFKLELFADRKPSQLSGGQQQRVAIARSLINRPRVLLLDEPLAALDLQLRKHMQFELKELQRQFGTTYIYVTHNQEEALTMSDRIIVMNEGTIEQTGTPQEVYNSPRTVFTAKFLGESNILPAAASGISIPDDQKNNCMVSIRPEFFHITSDGRADLPLSGEITEVTFLGNIYRIGVRLSTGQTIYVLEQKKNLTEHMHVSVSYDREKLTFVSQ
ncbi:MAG: ABC transporter ATP-binding protein [Treponema sp.]|nr:ABC transporter ATP-binding protein [Treponema sp.]